MSVDLVQGTHEDLDGRLYRTLHVNAKRVVPEVGRTGGLLALTRAEWTGTTTVPDEERSRVTYRTSGYRTAIHVDDVQRVDPCPLPYGFGARLVRKEYTSEHVRDLIVVEPFDQVAAAFGAAKDELAVRTDQAVAEANEEIARLRSRLEQSSHL